MQDTQNRFGRLWRHWLCDAREVRKRFGKEGFARIENAIAEGERKHGAEISFAVEASLDAYRLWAGVTPRERAHHHFSNLRVWDTELNNGVLLYVLLADRAVELVADREAARRIPQPVWDEACALMSKAFVKEQYTDGVLAALAHLQPSLEQVFPRLADDVNELPNTVHLV